MPSAFKRLITESKEVTTSSSVVTPILSKSETLVSTGMLWQQVAQQDWQSFFLKGIQFFIIKRVPKGNGYRWETFSVIPIRDENKQAISDFDC